MSDSDHDQRPPARGRTATTARLVAGLVLLVVIVAFAVDNRDDVRVGWVIGDGSAPLVLVLVVTAAVGALVGWLLLHRPTRNHQ
jgi:uncharacterized integral membrane protein